jgi:hypothetical protein
MTVPYLPSVCAQDLAKNEDFIAFVQALLELMETRRVSVNAVNKCTGEGFGVQFLRWHIPGCLLDRFWALQPSLALIWHDIVSSDDLQYWNFADKAMRVPALWEDLDCIEDTLKENGLDLYTCEKVRKQVEKSREGRRWSPCRSAWIAACVRLFFGGAACTYLSPCQGHHEPDHKGAESP